MYDKALYRGLSSRETGVNTQETWDASSSAGKILRSRISCFSSLSRLYILAHKIAILK